MKNIVPIFINIFIGLLMTTMSCDQKKSDSREKTNPERYTMADFKEVPKIDVHAHVNTEETWMIDEAIVNNFRLMVMAVDVVPDYPPMPEQLRVRVKHHREHPDIFAFSTAFTLERWDDPNWSEEVIDQLTEDFSNGAVGVKVWKNIGMEERDKDGNLIMLDDPKFDPIFRFIQEQDKVLISHAGEPKNCWLPLDEMTVKNDRNYFGDHPEYHMYLHPEMPSYQAQMDARDNMLFKNKDLTFVGAHMASLEWSIDEVAAFLDRFPNAVVDFAERLSHTQFQSQKDREKVRSFFIKYQDRILYGTDFQQLEESDEASLKRNMNEVWLLDWKYLNTDQMMKVPQLDTSFQGLALPKTVVDKIYCLNAERVFGKAWSTENL